MKPSIYFASSASAASLFLLSDLAHAYIGPGAGLGVIGTLIAFVGAVLLAIVGFVWYPVKRLLRKRKGAEMRTAKTESDSDDARQTQERKGESVSP